MELRITAVCFIFLLSVATLNLIPITAPIYDSFPIEQVSENRGQISTAAQGIIDEVLIEDTFVTAPLGFNDSLWNITTNNYPTLSWIDTDSLAMESELFTSATLASISNFGPEVIAEFEFTFTQGLCYFGIGWADQYIVQGEEWITDLRASQNGVFIDYCDTELFLVCYDDGNRVATPIVDLNLTVPHTYTLVWHNSLVSLYVDGVERGSISRQIPSVSLQFMLTTSGQHYLVQKDILLIDKVTIGTLEWNHYDNIPEVSLIWPANNSQIYSFDFIDLEIVGQNNSTYSWDGQTHISLYSPWDIQVPDQEGFHTLDIYSEDSFGNSTSLHLLFEVISEAPSIQVWNTLVAPIIDGELSIQEQNYMTMHNLNFRGEDRQIVKVDVLIGYVGESLYVGMATPVPDHWNSRISLLIDGSGDGIWGDAEVGVCEDIRITVSGPGLQNQFRGIYSHTGQEIQIAGVTYSPGVTSEGLVAEFLVPLDSVASNFTSGLGFGMIASCGGYDAFYPISIMESDCCVLQIAKSSGARPQDSFLGFIGSSLILIGIIPLIIGIFFVRKKRGFLEIEETLENESLERIRTLLLSHPQISLERLALLADTDTQNARKLIKNLQRKGLLEKTVQISENEIIRNIQSSEKNQM
ncbi:MAG: hypothetical protein KAU48_01140 [Candidatus Thorarchaeota archaeon]|nr:hypothetical protein [Candidatus Thorarchaeota archaeon]